VLAYDLIDEGGVRSGPHRHTRALKRGDLLYPANPGGANVLVLRVLAPLRARTAGQLLVRDVVEPR
jgi:hypothetical protein